MDDRAGMEDGRSSAPARQGLRRRLQRGAVNRHAIGMGAGRILFAAVMIGLGIRGLAYGDLASVWQRMPIAHLSARPLIAHACAVAELLIGMGLLWRRTIATASALATLFLLLWVVLLKIPPVLAAAQIEASWLGLGEIAVMLSGSWILFAVHAGSWARNHLAWAVGTGGIGWARRLLVLALPTIGLAHFVYADATVALIPAWMPCRYALVYLTGAGNFAASLGILFSVMPRLAAAAEAAMLSAITVVVWLPGLIAAPTDATWTPFLISMGIASGVWLVADSYLAGAWFEVGPGARVAHDEPDRDAAMTARRG